MKELDIGGPDLHARHAVYTAAGMSDANVRAIEEIVRGSGQRQVGAGALGNVVTRFDSLKNHHYRLVESHTCELIHAYELELDPDVIGYYTQAPCVGVTRVSPEGRKHVSSAHLDFLVFRRCSVELVECKQLDWLEKKQLDGHPDWCRVEGQWLCKPYQAWSEARGMQFNVWVGPKHPAIYLQNQAIIYDAMRIECTDYEMRACRTAAKLLKKRSLSISDIHNELAGFNSRVAFLMLARGEAFGPCRSISLAHESKFHLFSIPEQAANYERLAAEDAAEKFSQLDELNDPILLATETDLKNAKKRLHRVRQVESGLLTPSKKLKSLAKRVAEAEGKGESSLAACLTRYHASGNRTPRLAPAYGELCTRIIAEYWNSGRVATTSDAIRVYELECKQLGLPVAGQTALRMAIRQADPERHALRTRGLRGYQSVRRNTDPRFTSAPPLAYGAIAHIDSTPIDMRMVEKQTGGVMALRANFYVAIDGASGCPLAYTLIFGPSRTEGLAILIRQIVRRNGFLPRTIHVDRGPENTSKWMEEFCEGRISLRHSPTAGSAWNQLAESANKFVNTQVSHRLFGSTLPDKNGRSIDSKYKSLKTARMDFVEVNELIEKYIHGELSHTPGIDNLSPIERRQRCLDQFGCMGNKCKLDDNLLLATSIPIGTTPKLTGRGSIRIEEGTYTSRELQQATKGRKRIDDARIDSEDPAILHVRINGLWMKAFHRKVQSVANDDRLERLFDLFYAPTARRLSREVKKLLRRQSHDRTEEAKRACSEERATRNKSQEKPRNKREGKKVGRPDTEGPLYASEG